MHGELRCSVRVNSSCSTSGTRRVTIVYCIIIHRLLELLLLNVICNAMIKTKCTRKYKDPIKLIVLDPHFRIQFYRWHVNIIRIILENNTMLSGVIDTDFTGSWKSNYHTITTTMTLLNVWDWRRTDNTMANRKNYKRTNNDLENIHIKLQTE
jgi:hypothetical protein